MNQNQNNFQANALFAPLDKSVPAAEPMQPVDRTFTDTAIQASSVQMPHFSLYHD